MCSGLNNPTITQIPHKHAHPIATHLGKGPVGIAVVHEPSGPAGVGMSITMGVLNTNRPQDAVGTNAAASIADGSDHIGGQGQTTFRIEQQDEVIPRAMPLPKGHGSKGARHEATLSRNRVDEVGCVVEPVDPVIPAKPRLLTTGEASRGPHGFVACLLGRQVPVQHGEHLGVAECA